MMQQTVPSKVSLLVAAATALLGAVDVDANRMAFHFDGMDHAGCKSGTFDMKLNQLKFICNGEDNLCRPGDLVTVEGHCKSRTKE